MAENPTLQIPKDVIEPIIQAHVAAAVTQALGNNAELVRQAIAHVLNEKVDTTGRRNDYSYQNTVPFIQWAVRDCVQKATLAAIQEAMTKNQAVVKKLIVEELKRTNSPLVRQLIEAMTNQFTGQHLTYALKVSYDANS